MPALLGRYRLIERIGLGGMAEVWRAAVEGPSGFEKTVVLKRIRPEIGEDPEFVRMLVAEAKIGAALEHPNIVEIFDLGFADGTYFLVMQFVPGVDLFRLMAHRRARGARLAAPLAAYVGTEVLRALEFAHGRAAGPVIHRDVSPQNVLLSTAGVVKLTDFGIARALDQVRLTQPGVLKGKIGYMSPEQLAGQDLDARSDLYSLGVVLWEAIAGKRLFVGDSDAATIEKVRRAEVAPLATEAPEAAETLAPLVHRALSKERDERWGSATDFRRALEAYLSQSELPADAPSLALLVREAYAAAPTEPAPDATVRVPPREIGTLWAESPSFPPQTDPEIHERVTEMLGPPPATEAVHERPTEPLQTTRAVRDDDRWRRRDVAVLFFAGVVLVLLAVFLAVARPVRAQIQFVGAPRGARIYVDGTRVVPGTDGTVPVRPGVRSVRVVGPGGRVEAREVVVGRGAVRPLDLRGAAHPQ